MEYGIFEDSEWIWDNNQQKLFRKLIESNRYNTSYNHEEFKEVKYKPHKSRGDKYYYQVKICNKMYRLHRLLYYLYNPDWDIYDCSSNNIIDHRDGNGLNNRIENLTNCSQKENCENRKNTIGYCFIKKKNCFLAYFHKDGKAIKKSFSIKKLGLEKAEQLAKEWREEKVNEFYYKG